MSLMGSILTAEKRADQQAAAAELARKTPTAEHGSMPRKPPHPKFDKKMIGRWVRIGWPKSVATFGVLTRISQDRMTGEVFFLYPVHLGFGVVRTIDIAQLVLVGPLFEVPDEALNVLYHRRRGKAYVPKPMRIREDKKPAKKEPVKPTKATVAALSKFVKETKPNTPDPRKVAQEILDKGRTPKKPAAKSAPKKTAKKPAAKKPEKNFLADWSRVILGDYGATPKGVTTANWRKAVMNRVKDMQKRVYGHDTVQLPLPKKIEVAAGVLRLNPHLVPHYIIKSTPPREETKPAKKLLKIIRRK